MISDVSVWVFGIILIISGDKLILSYSEVLQVDNKFSEMCMLSQNIFFFFLLNIKFVKKLVALEIKGTFDSLELFVVIENQNHNHDFKYS